MKDEDEERFPSGRHTCRIDCFSDKMQNHTIISEAFTIGGCRWKLIIYPVSGKDQDSLGVFLAVADDTALPVGWCRDVQFVITLVDQHGRGSSIIKGGRNKYVAGSAGWGRQKFVSLTDLYDQTKGYVVNDTVVIEVKLILHEVVPPVELLAHKSRFESYFSSVSEDTGASGCGTFHMVAGSVSDTENTGLSSETLSSDDIDKAKESLKECLSDLFKIDMRDRLSSALLILSKAGTQLSPHQHESVETFRSNFDDFMYDFLSFEQGNFDFELQKIANDQIYAAMKKNHETHLSYMQLLDSLTKEKEELNERLKELSLKETKLVCDWETLMKDDEEVKSKYTVQEKKLSEALERKKICEERMSRSSSAWSNLRDQFL